MQIRYLLHGSYNGHFYMLNLENIVFENYPNIKPVVYTRYVDHCFIVTDSVENVVAMKEIFEQNSVLHFTYLK